MIAMTSRSVFTPRTVLVSALSILTACAGKEQVNAGADSSTSAVVAATPVTNPGEATYAQICASCHQATGLGLDGNYPPLKNSAWLTGEPSVPISIVLAGLQGEITVDGKPYNGVMQAWSMLSDVDVANVLTYARSQWGNTAGAVTPAQVKAVRDVMGSRGPWTAAELKKVYPSAGL
jgi:mono/diheme cytochrome c family protein